MLIYVTQDTSKHDWETKVTSCTCPPQSSGKKWREHLCCTCFICKHRGPLKYCPSWSNIAMAIGREQIFTPSHCDSLQLPHVWPSPMFSSMTALCVRPQMPYPWHQVWSKPCKRTQFLLHKRRNCKICSVNWEKAEYCLERVSVLSSFRFAKNSVMSHIIYFILFPKHFAPFFRLGIDFCNPPGEAIITFLFLLLAFVLKPLAHV